ncbi:MAG: glycosyltransferase, partial [Planctomycetota bacterium]|nr:glycosyltransferase [Planctomycetota bacterium]
TASDGQQEGQGLVLQEAQATGMPVVSTLQGGIPDGVVDAESGFLVPEKDAGALADRLSYLIDNSHLWPSMGRAGRRLVEDDFDIDKLNDRLVELYRRAILNPS